MPEPGAKTHVPSNGQNFADKNATGADDYGAIARRITCGVAGELWLIPAEGGAEFLVLANCPAGAPITHQHSGIGASTTAEDFFVQFE